MHAGLGQDPWLSSTANIGTKETGHGYKTVARIFKSLLSFQNLYCWFSQFQTPVDSDNISQYMLQGSDTRVLGLGF